MNTPPHEVAEAFCLEHLGRSCFAEFTELDASGWGAFVHLVEMWGRGNQAEREGTVVAMRAVLSTAQSKESIHRVFCQAIPALLDWRHADEIWPQLIVGAPGRVYCGTNWRLTPVREVAVKPVHPPVDKVRR